MVGVRFMSLVEEYGRNVVEVVEEKWKDDGL
jgi:hypothetical protein